MSAPNVVRVSTINGNTQGRLLTTSSADIVINTAASGKLYKINSVMITNYTASTANANVQYYSATDSLSYFVGSIAIPGYQTLDLLSKSLYLKEGDKLQANSSIANSLHLVTSFEEIS